MSYRGLSITVKADDRRDVSRSRDSRRDADRRDADRREANRRDADRRDVDRHARGRDDILGPIQRDRDRSSRNPSDNRREDRGSRRPRSSERRVVDQDRNRKHGRRRQSRSRSRTPERDRTARDRRNVIESHNSGADRRNQDTRQYKHKELDIDPTADLRRFVVKTGRLYQKEQLVDLNCITAIIWRKIKRVT